MKRIYHRDEQGFITIESAGTWSKRAYLESRITHGHELVSQGVDDLMGWPDTKVEWYGWTRDSASAVGFPVAATTSIYVNYDHNTDGAGDEEIARFEAELRRQYGDDLNALAVDLQTLEDTGECDRYDNAVAAAERFAFAHWSSHPESIVFSVQVGA